MGVGRLARRHKKPARAKDADIFHSAMSSYGGRLDLTNNPNSAYWSAFKKMADEMIAAQKRFMPKMPHVHFEFVNHPLLQAVAFTDQGRHFISVFAGAVLLLDTLFSRIMCDRRFLQDIGNVTLERDERQLIPWPILDAKSLYDAGIGPLVPNCPARLEYKCRLQEWSFRFLIAHELGHITEGHVDYSSQKCGIPFLAEMGWIGKSESETLTRQCFEMDADGQAAGFVAANMTAETPNFTHPVSMELRVFGAVFAFCSVFHLFGESAFTGQEARGAYPPVRVRQAWCSKLAGEMIQEWPADRREPCFRALECAISRVESIIPEITGRTRTLDCLKEALGTVGQDYTDKLIRHRDSVVLPITKPFKYHDFGTPA
jgi:hypothetical protein